MHAPMAACRPCVQSANRPRGLAISILELNQGIFHLGHWDFPLVGGGSLDHLPRRGAALAHIVLRLADAAAAGAVVVAPYPLAGDVLAGRGIFGRDLRPVAFEF